MPPPTASDISSLKSSCGDQIKVLVTILDQVIVKGKCFEENAFKEITKLANITESMIKKTGKVLALVDVNPSSLGTTGGYGSGGHGGSGGSPGMPGAPGYKK